MVGNSFIANGILAGIGLGLGLTPEQIDRVKLALINNPTDGYKNPSDMIVDIETAALSLGYLTKDVRKAVGSVDNG